MPRRPDIPPALIREVLLSEGGETRMSSVRAAEILSRRIGRPVNPKTIRSVIHRYGKEWNLPPVEESTGLPSKAMDYRAEEVFGEFPSRHKRSHAWQMISAWERIQGGQLASKKEGDLADKAVGYVQSLLDHGDVVDRDGRGFYVRPAWPWEVGDYLPAPEPPDAVRWLLEALQGSTGVYRGVLVTEEHRAAWTARLAEEEMG